MLDCNFTKISESQLKDYFKKFFDMSQNDAGTTVPVIMQGFQEIKQKEIESYLASFGSEIALLGTLCGLQWLKDFKKLECNIDNHYRICVPVNEPGLQITSDTVHPVLILKLEAFRWYAQKLWDINYTDHKFHGGRCLWSEWFAVLWQSIRYVDPTVSEDGNNFECTCYLDPDIARMTMSDDSNTQCAMEEIFKHHVSFAAIKVSVNISGSQKVFAIEKTLKEINR